MNKTLVGLVWVLSAAPVMSAWALNDGLGGGDGAARTPAAAPMMAPMMAPGGDGGAAAKDYENGGKVLSEKTGNGYTYLELENQGHKFWVAGPVSKVKKGDKVKVKPNVIMEGFNSKFMNRTFDRIIFVSAIEAAK